jgi:hypothetical protein
MLPLKTYVYIDGFNFFNEKDRIFEVVNPILSRSESREDFIKDLEASGFRFYTRGKNHGVQDTATGRKYRFKTLGLDQRFVAVQNQWKQLSVRSRELESIRTEKAAHRLKEMSFRDDVFDALSADPDPESLMISACHNSKKELLLSVY